MKNTFKWIVFQSSNAEVFEHLKYQIMALKYVRSKGKGFTVESIDSQSVRGSYIEKFSFSESIPIPFGKPRLYSQTRFKIIDFKIFNDPFILEIVNQKFPIPEFISLLSLMTNHTLTLHESVITPIEWLSEIEERVGKPLVVDAAKAMGINLGKDSFASFTIRSAASDIRRKMRAFLKEYDYRIGKIRMLIEDAVVEISSSGLCTVTGEYSLSLIDLIRESLYKSMERE